MKKLIVSLLCLVMLCSCGFEKLSKSERQLEVAWQVTNVADVITTTKGIHQGLHELNPIIGGSPSDTEILVFGAGMGVLHYGVTYWSRDTEFEPYWQWGSLGVKLFAVGNNIVQVEW